MRGGAASSSCADRGQRRLDVVRGSRPECRRRAPRPPASRPARSSPAADRHGDDAAREAGEIAAGSPRCPWSRACRRSAPAAAARAPRDRPAPPRRRGRHRRCGRRRATARCRAARAPRAPCVSRCMRAGHSALAMPASKAASGSSRPDGAQRGDRGAGIVELMAAEQLRRRQIEQPVVVLIDQPAVLLVHVPVLAGDAQRRAHALRLALDHARAPRRACGAIDRRHAALEDAGLLGGDLLDACRRETRMIERDRRDRRWRAASRSRWWHRAGRRGRLRAAAHRPDGARTAGTPPRS